MDEPTFHELLQRGAKHKASDALFKVGQPPAFRVSGALHYLQGERLRPEHTTALAQLVMRQARFAGDLDAMMEFDTAYSVPGIGRYRVNIFRQRGSLALALRNIPLQIPSFEDLRCTPVAASLAEQKRGLVLVVGAAGNGKSSTLAAMIGHLNNNRRVHVLTIEDPIEFLHQDNLATISQREVGLDTPDFATALRAALRQDPDVILVGEIRDEETMDIALKAAETGHLVMSTLHTPDVARTVGRVISLAKDADPSETRERFCDNLKGIIAQRLLPTADGEGRALAQEVLVTTGSAKESIRNPENSMSLREVMERGTHPYGMQTFEMHIRKLVQEGRVSVETARRALG
ncbi:MAG: PilT/PilU family type 4a pilus ATPase [Myxococcales bacterium]|nr:PilT/PilU family type 4a pilus ATPase [Myxococcales bacterium]MDD9967404.1 PilT/PilU family type 4a pilus ATPase [Myxococcales bacterium]